MASFADMYDSCFKNVILLSIGANFDELTSHKKSTKCSTELLTESCVTLDSVFRSNQVVGFYFSRTQSANCLAFTDELKKFWTEKCFVNKYNQSASNKTRRFLGFKKKNKKGKDSPKDCFAIVVVCLDGQIVDTPLSLLGHNDWYALTTDSAKIKTRLMRSVGFQQTPSLVLIDSVSRQIITSDGKRAMQQDSKAVHFPWYPASTGQLFESSLLRNEVAEDGSVTQKTVHFTDLKPAVKGLFFGANWCPPCRVFEQQLIKTYEKLKANGVLFEIFFCSSDRSEQSFRQHFSSMPWLAFPFNQNKLTDFTRLYNVHGIPALLILDEQNQLITRHGRNAVLADPEGEQFPWRVQLMYELNEYTVCRLKDEPSLILFTECSSEEDMAFSRQVLLPSAERAFEDRKYVAVERDSLSSSSSSSCSSSKDTVPVNADPIQFFYTADDTLSDQMLECLGLAEMELPLLVIVDTMAGQMTVCDRPHVDQDIVENFLADFKSDKLPWTAFPESVNGRGGSGPSQVGGIPVAAIAQAFGIGSSPSQNNIVLHNFEQSTTNSNNKSDKNLSH